MKIGKTQRMSKETKWPYCKTLLTSVSSLTEDVRPSPKDYTVCLGCLEVLVFTTSLGLRKPTYGEKIVANDLEEVIEFKKQIKRVQEVYLKRN